MAQTLMPSSAVDMLNAIQRARRLDRKSLDQELPGSVSQRGQARARDLVDFLHLDELLTFRSLKILIYTLYDYTYSRYVIYMNLYDMLNLYFDNLT